MGLMGSEVSLHYGSKSLRADIVVYDRAGEPLMVVECKRPDVQIDTEVAQQALRYHGVLGVRFIGLTNGNNTYIYRREGKGFVAADRLPAAPEKGHRPVRGPVDPNVLQCGTGVQHAKCSNLQQDEDCRTCKE